MFSSLKLPTTAIIDGFSSTLHVATGHSPRLFHVLWEIQYRRTDAIVQQTARSNMAHCTGTVFVFGAAANSMHLEAFDANTGNSRDWFSASCWSTHSERWNLHLIDLKATEMP